MGGLYGRRISVDRERLAARIGVPAYLAEALAAGLEERSTPLQSALISRWVEVRVMGGTWHEVDRVIAAVNARDDAELDRIEGMLTSRQIGRDLPGTQPAPEPPTEVLEPDRTCRYCPSVLRSRRSRGQHERRHRERGDVMLADHEATSVDAQPPTESSSASTSVDRPIALGARITVAELVEIFPDAVALEARGGLILVHRRAA